MRDPWLTQCPNPMHILHLGRWTFAFQWAQDFWAAEEKNYRVRHFFQLAQVISDSEQTALRLIVHRMSVWVARVA